MKKNLLILGGILLMSVLATLWLDGTWQKTPSPAAYKVHSVVSLGAALPDFTFEATTGGKQSLTDFRGKAVIINLWASWCAPCVAEFPEMLRLAKETQNEAVYLFVSSDKEFSRAERFLETQDQTLLALENVLIIHDKGWPITRDLFKTSRLPETYLVDAQGVLQEKMLGHNVKWDSDGIISRVRSLSQ